MTRLFSVLQYTKFALTLAHEHLVCSRIESLWEMSRGTDISIFRHLIAFNDLDEHIILIVRVLHERMDIDNHLQDL